MSISVPLQHPRGVGQHHPDPEPYLASFLNTSFSFLSLFIVRYIWCHLILKWSPYCAFRASKIGKIKVGRVCTCTPTNTCMFRNSYKIYMCSIQNHFPGDFT